MKYIWANIYSTTHLWSFCYFDDKENKLKAIELERLDRYKNSPNLSSFSLIPKVEGYHKQKLINYFNISWKFKSLNFDRTNILKKHHYLHACSVYYSNNIDSGAILCMDRNWYDSDMGNQFQTIWYWDKMDISFKYSSKIKSQIDRGIGFAYYIISEFLRLWEWSVMWLSAYWNKDYYKEIEIYEYRDNGVYFNKNFLKNCVIEKSNNIEFDKEYDIFDEKNGNREIILKNIKDIFRITKGDLIKAKEDIINSKYAHIAALLQYQTEEAILYLAKKAYEISKSKNLCLAGGVALNILANTRILKETKFENIYISPVSEDIWLALWAFYHLYHIQEANKNRIFLEKTWYWRSYSRKEVLKDLEEFKDDIKIIEYWDNKIYDIVTDKLIEDKVLWWFQWWSEFWPRALGNRSIIAWPNSIELKNKVNNIKSRELWRPIAPSILEEDIDKYFDISFLSTFMSFSWNINKSKLDEIKWVVHIDNTSRYQSVSEKNNLNYYKLIKLYKEKTGIPIIINTSMNTKKEPIVESPRDAIAMLLSTQLDYLVIDNFFISKKLNNYKYKFNYENIRLKRNLLSYENRKSIINRKLLIDKLKILFSSFDFKFDNYFYDEKIIFFIDWDKYIIEKFSKNINYLFHNNKTWLIKIWKYSISDEKIIELIFYKLDIDSYIYSQNYILNDY